MRKTALMILSKTQTDIEYIIDLKFCILQNNELLCMITSIGLRYHIQLNFKIP
jgi:hypothetical protein